MFKFYIKKYYLRRTCSSETKQNFKKPYLPIFKFMRISTFYGWFRTKDLTIHICDVNEWATTTLVISWEIWKLYQKNIFPETSKIRRNLGNPKKT